MFYPKEILTRIKYFLSEKEGSRFKLNFVKVVKANSLTFGLSLLFYPLLTRLYTPTDFVVVTLFISLISILSAFASLRFEWSVPNAASHTQATALIVAGFFMVVITTTTTFIVLKLFSSNWSFWRGFQVISPYLLLIPIALVGTSLQQLMQSWFVREADLTAVSKAKITQSLISTILNSACGILKYGALGLIVSSIVASWVGSSLLIRHAKGLRESLRKLPIIELKKSSLQFGKDSVFSSVASLINTMSLTITPFLLAQFYNPKEVGWYALAMRIALTPIGVFTSAIAQSFWAEAASLVKTDRVTLRRLYLRTSKRMAVFAIPVMGLCLLGPLYTEFIFGEVWANAGYILAALTPQLFGQIVVSPLSHLIVHRKQHWQTLWDVARLTLLVMALIIAGVMNLSIYLTILISSLIMLVMYAILFNLNIIILIKKS